MKVVQTDMIGLGFDRTALLTREQARTLVEYGLINAMRNCAAISDDDFKNDVVNCLEAGMTVGIYQGSFPDMWKDLTLAKSRALEACHKAHVVGYPEYATLWLNVESITTEKERVMEWINTWSETVRGYGYGAGVYCGIDTLTGEEYYSLPYVTHYWQNCSSWNRISIPNRGFQIFQHLCDTTTSGIDVDIDMFTKDRLGQASCGMKIE